MESQPWQTSLGRLTVVPVGDAGTVPHGRRNAFEGVRGYADSSPGAGDGCPLSSLVRQFMGSELVARDQNKTFSREN